MAPRLHRKKEGPERGLACRTCRSKKQKCDRERPSCTECIAAFEPCVYVSRKQKATVTELEEILKIREREYSRLTGTDSRGDRSTQRTTRASDLSASTITAVEGDVLSTIFHHPQHPSAHTLTSSGGFTASTSASIHFDGYAFDESFLTMPTARSSSTLSSRQDAIPSFTMDLRGQSNGSFRRNNAPDLSMRVFSSPTAIHSSLRGESGGHALDSRSLTSPFVAADDEQTSDSPSQLVRQHLYAETITQEPSLNFSRATWWDHLLQTYTIRSAPYGTVTVARNLQDSSKEISQDVCRFFKVASIYLHFINVPLFFDMFHHTELRSSIQPAFIMSILAHSKLIEFYVRGGERDDEGECIWKQSIMLRELAQAAFDASYNADWIDLPLAQAAWILHWYEVGAHRDSTSARKEAALALLDNVIHVLNLTRVDAEDTRAPRFTAGAAPTLGRPDPVVPLPPTATTEFNPVVGCPCHALSLSRNPETARSTPAWSKMPGWGDNESEAEIRKEQARRLVWSAVVISAVISVTRLVDGYRQLDLHVARPENLAVMYPGEEALSREAKITTQYSGKESTCALLSRAALLLLACIQELPKIRAQTALPGSKEATLDLQVVTDFEVNAWVETSLIEDALDAHTCKIEQPVYQTRDYTLTVRLLLCGGFLQSMPPMPRTAPFARIDYDLAIRWLRHLADTMGQAFAVMMNNYDNSLRQHIASRPFLTSWTIAQMWRCVELWKLENSLTLALDVALDAVPLLRLFEATWPCSEERRHGARLIDELTSICALLGREAP